MKEKDMAIAIKSMTSVAKKVFDAVPIKEPWHITQIANELFRLGIKLENSMIAGCLASLEKQGVIIEKPRGVFIRASVKDYQPIPEIADIQLRKTISLQQEKEPMTNKSPIEKLAALSQRVTVAMNALRDIAADIEVAAIEIDEQAKSADQGAQKLQQLKSLLKELT